MAKTKGIIVVLGMLMCCAVWAARDPTMPIEEHTAQISTDETTVSMILVSGERRLAVVDGNFVHTGDTVGDQRIIEINPEYVTIQNMTTGERKNFPVIATDIKLYAQ